MCDTVMIDGEKFLIVPIRKYERPNGKLTNEQFHVPWSEKLEYNLDAMIECDYHITFEVVPGHMVNICVEDDDNDYAVELVRPGSRDDGIALAFGLTVIHEHGYRRLFAEPHVLQRVLPGTGILLQQHAASVILARQPGEDLVAGGGHGLSHQRTDQRLGDRKSEE